MPRKRVQFTPQKFYTLLNSRDDLTAVVHGLSSIEALMDEALEMLLAGSGIKDDAFLNLRIVEKADVLIVSDRLDVEVRPLLLHLTGIRNRFAHRLQTALTAGEGAQAWDLLPDAAKGSAPIGMSRTSPAAEVVRWCLAVVATRIRNRAVLGNRANVPYS